MAAASELSLEPQADVGRRFRHPISLLDLLAEPAKGRLVRAAELGEVQDQLLSGSSAVLLQLAQVILLETASDADHGLRIGIGRSYSDQGSTLDFVRVWIREGKSRATARPQRPASETVRCFQGWGALGAVLTAEQGL
jgi:hypothetical protein